MNIYFIFLLITLFFLFILLYPVLVASDITKKQKLIFVFVLSVFFSGAVLLLYNKFGTPEILPLLAQREAKLLELKEKITRNSETVKKDPKNLKAWLELGDSFIETNQFSAAANAYKQAVLISEGNPEFIMSYSRSLILNADGIIIDDAKKGLEMVLSLQPENEEARYFMAVHKLQNGNSKEAMADMKKLYHSLKSDSPMKVIIDRQIGKQN